MIRLKVKTTNNEKYLKTFKTREDADNYLDELALGVNK